MSSLARFGIALLDADADSDGEVRLVLALREGADPRALIEARRHLGRPFSVETVPAERFDRILSDNYALDGQAAADAADSLGFGDELRHLASDIPTAEELLDSAAGAALSRLKQRFDPRRDHHSQALSR